MSALAEVSRDELLRSRRTVIAREPEAQSIQSGKECPLVDIRLIQFVANLLLELRRDHDPVKQVFSSIEPLADA